MSRANSTKSPQTHLTCTRSELSISHEHKHVTTEVNRRLHPQTAADSIHIISSAGAGVTGVSGGGGSKVTQVGVYLTAVADREQDWRTFGGGQLLDFFTSLI